MTRKQNIIRDLRNRDPNEIAKKTGAKLQEGKLVLEMFDEEFQVELPDFEVKQSSEPEKTHLEKLILNYLYRTDCPQSSEKWISFREIPHGNFYSSNFKKNTENRLSRKFQGKREKFEDVSKVLGGEEIDIGDAGYKFQALPRFNIALVFWSGGDEFQDNVNVLFQESASQCLSAEGLSIIGKEVCNKFIEKAEE